MCRTSGLHCKLHSKQFTLIIILNLNIFLFSGDLLPILLILCHTLAASQIAKLEQDSGDSEDLTRAASPSCPPRLLSLLHSVFQTIHIHFEAPGHSTHHIPLYIMLICDHFLLLLLLAPINDGSWRNPPSLIGVNIGPDTLALVSKLCRKCDNKAFYPEPRPPRG